MSMLLDEKNVNLIIEVCDKIIRFDDFKKAFEFYPLLENLLIKKKDDFVSQKELEKLIKELTYKLQFIAFPLLDNKSAISLLKNNFLIQFNIESYYFLSKYKMKLTNMEVYEDRDKFNLEVKNDLLNNQDILTSDSKNIADWLKDYNIHLGTGKVDSLKRVQYFSELKNKKLKINDLNRLRLLFDFYEILKKSAFSPEGFWESVPIEIDEKLYIFEEGDLIDIEQEKFKENKVGIPKTAAEKEIDALSHEEEKYKEGSLERLALDEEIDKKRKIDDLQIEINKYKENSLERRALEDELNKLKAQ